MDHEDESVSHWIDELKTGDSEAAERLWNRYYEELVRLARAKLGAVSRASADEEDVALSAFNSLCAGAARGQYPGLGDRHDLWRLLVTITIRKALDLVQHERRLKRGGGSVIGERDLCRQGESRGAKGLDYFEAPGPAPELAVIMADEQERLLARLVDDNLRRVALRRLEGCTGEEIAIELSCNRRTVVRKLELIRAIWLEAETP
jgi:DNA-directed RNA polymerase specialized sigma24 family protein